MMKIQNNRNTSNEKGAYIPKLSKKVRTFFEPQNIKIAHKANNLMKKLFKTQFSKVKKNIGYEFRCNNCKKSRSDK